MQVKLVLIAALWVLPLVASLAVETTTTENPYAEEIENFRQFVIGSLGELRDVLRDPFEYPDPFSVDTTNPDLAQIRGSISNVTYYGLNHLSMCKFTSAYPTKFFILSFRERYQSFTGTYSLDGIFYNNGLPLPFGGEGKFTMDLLGIASFGPIIPNNYTFDFEGLFTNSDIPAEFHDPIHHQIYSAVEGRMLRRLVENYIVPELRPIFNKNFEKWSYADILGGHFTPFNSTMTWDCYGLWP
ncbi:hypothetical protein Fcan01_13652 [Folsomia candida]|uniref:Uncharacterized protein n=1 Tax=Folsomia candida TaxID=158441 RepID=A0A226E2I9_FOLCA|nr:hypothetical protein Fcan01_13652 [Folsomia candida]